MIFIDLASLNTLISLCIDYGGDPGGPYYDDRSLSCLCAFLNEFCKRIPGLHYRIDSDHQVILYFE